MIFFFRQKMKDDLSQKMHGNMIFYSNDMKRWSFPKIALECYLSYIIWKDGIFLLENMIFFP